MRAQAAHPIQKVRNACQMPRNTRSKDARHDWRARYCDQFGLWLSLVERLVRDQEAVGSNPTSPIIFVRNGDAFRLLPHFFLM
jgi:hypothetical protein